MTYFGFVRHGSTQWNIEGRAQGLSDIPLNNDGLQQARLLAAKLECEQWDVIYSSDLLRARQTAELLSDQLKCELYLDERLRELAGGMIEGTTETERIERWGENWRNVELGIEPGEAGVVRVTAMLQEILHNHKGKRVLIVSHGSLLRHLFLSLLPEENTETKLGNTSITRLEFKEPSWHCHKYNCTEHLS